MGMAVGGRMRQCGGSRDGYSGARADAKARKGSGTLIVKDWGWNLGFVW